ncbi:MAG TPA: hypothetical protein PLP19_01890 [bacterium]|nr:hypothetical protein [bacterium]HPN42218.1 hypothetical protein [bacterium]
MKFYQFLADCGIHLVDYSGKIDLQTGLSRMEKLQHYFDKHVEQGLSLKILFDVRKTVWADEQTHTELAQIARCKFATSRHNYPAYIAIVNNQYNGSAFDNERWFTGKDEAMNWLLSQPD